MFPKDHIVKDRLVDSLGTDYDQQFYSGCCCGPSVMKSDVARLAGDIGASHLELLERLDVTWAETRLAHYVEVLSKYPYKTADHSPAATGAATDFLLGAVRVTYGAHASTGIELATSALIADGLRRNGVGLDEIRRIDRWTSRLPAPADESPLL